MAIGLAAQLSSVPIEALATVVLAHELSHAYSHLGYNIDGQVWDTRAFAATDVYIVEGLAQFYTEWIGGRLEARDPSVKAAYTKLLKRQRGPYLAHLGWCDDRSNGAEVVRVSMIECRTKNIRGHEEFVDAFKRYRGLIRG